MPSSSWARVVRNLSSSGMRDRVAEGLAAADDADLVHRVGVGQEVAHQGVAHLVVGGHHPLLLGEQAALLLGAGDHAHDPLLELGLLDQALALARGQQGGLVDQVGQVGAGEAGGLAGQGRRGRSPWRSACPWCGRPGSGRGRRGRGGRPRSGGRSAPGRSRAGSRMSGRLVAAIRMMLSLASKPSISTSSWLRVCSRSSWPPPRPAPRWRPTASISSMKMMQGLFCLACSKRSRTRDGPHADEHLDEVRARDREEGHAGLAGHRPGQQRLAGAGGAEEQHALRDARPQALELLGVLEELLDLLELLDRLGDAGHVLEGDLGGIDGHPLGPATCRSS